MPGFVGGQRQFDQTSRVIEKPAFSIKRTLKKRETIGIHKLNKVTGYKINIQKQALYIINSMAKNELAKLSSILKQTAYKVTCQLSGPEEGRRECAQEVQNLTSTQRSAGCCQWTYRHISFE